MRFFPQHPWEPRHAGTLLLTSARMALEVRKVVGGDVETCPCARPTWAPSKQRCPTAQECLTFSPFVSRPRVRHQQQTLGSLFPHPHSGRAPPEDTVTSPHPALSPAMATTPVHPAQILQGRFAWLDSVGFDQPLGLVEGPGETLTKDDPEPALLTQFRSAPSAGWPKSPRGPALPWSTPAFPLASA